MINTTQMVLLNYSMVTAISMTKQPSPYHSYPFYLYSSSPLSGLRVQFAEWSSPWRSKSDASPTQHALLPRPDDNVSSNEQIHHESGLRFSSGVIIVRRFVRPTVLLMFSAVSCRHGCIIVFVFSEKRPKRPKNYLNSLYRESLHEDPEPVEKRS